jgi:aminoglycoside phosphotransferase (APT) family kinase protein
LQPGNAVRALRVRHLLESVFSDASELPSPITGIELIQSWHVDTYRVQAGGQTFIAQLTLYDAPGLARSSRKMRRVLELSEHAVPQPLAWRASDPGESPRWALLVTSFIRGEELSAHTFSRTAWLDLCSLLLRLHASTERAAEKKLQVADGAVADLRHANGFDELSEQLKRQLGAPGQRIGAAWLHQQLREMSRFVDQRASAFSSPKSLIHGDLVRSNIRVSGTKVALVDWADSGVGDPAYDLATVKFALDSVVPRQSSRLIQELARQYRDRLGDESIEARLRFYMPLPGLNIALAYWTRAATFPIARDLRVRACLLHSRAQWRRPLQLDGDPGVHPVMTDQGWLRWATPKAWIAPR